MDDLNDLEIWKSLEGLYEDELVIILGTGPSTAFYDPQYFKAYPTIGCTNVGYYYEPTYLITADPVMNGSKIHHGWKASVDAVRFAPQGYFVAKEYNPIRFDWKSGWENFNPLQKICCSTSVVLVAIQIAMYFKANPIYIVGMDGCVYQGASYCWQVDKKTDKTYQQGFNPKWREQVIIKSQMLNDKANILDLSPVSNYGVFKKKINTSNLKTKYLETFRSST